MHCSIFNTEEGMTNVNFCDSLTKTNEFKWSHFSFCQPQIKSCEFTSKHHYNYNNTTQSIKKLQKRFSTIFMIYCYHSDQKSSIVMTVKEISMNIHTLNHKTLHFDRVKIFNKNPKDRRKGSVIERCPFNRGSFML